MGTLRRSFERARASTRVVPRCYVNCNLPLQLSWTATLLVALLSAVTQAGTGETALQTDESGGRSTSSLFLSPRVPKKFLLPYKPTREISQGALQTDQDTRAPADEPAPVKLATFKEETAAKNVDHSIYFHIGDRSQPASPAEGSVSVSHPWESPQALPVKVFPAPDDCHEEFIDDSSNIGPELDQPAEPDLPIDDTFSGLPSQDDESHDQEPISDNEATDTNSQATVNSDFVTEGVTETRTASRLDEDFFKQKSAVRVAAMDAWILSRLSSGSNSEDQSDSGDVFLRKVSSNATDRDDTSGNANEREPSGIIDLFSKPIDVRGRQNVVLRTKHDIDRTAAVDPAICDIIPFTPRELSLMGLKPGSTTVTLWCQNKCQRPLTYVVNVTPDLKVHCQLEDEYDSLARILMELFPDSKVELQPVADKLIVRGQAKDIEEAVRILQIIQSEKDSPARQETQKPEFSDNPSQDPSIGGQAVSVLSSNELERQTGDGLTIVNLLRVPSPQQIMLQVRLAELNRSIARGFGTDMESGMNASDTAELLVRSMLTASAAANKNVTSPSVVTHTDRDAIEKSIRRLEQQGVIRMLSEPTLVTLSGCPVTFVADGEFALPTAVGVEDRGAMATDGGTLGAVISFLPTVVDKDLIRLEVAPEFSQINTALNTNSSFSIDIRSVTTTVEMREGQTLATVGLRENVMKNTRREDLPILSHIFGKRDGSRHDVSRHETELIILVTPELIDPLDLEEVPSLPSFDVTEVNDHDFYLHGHLEGNPTQGHGRTSWSRLPKRYARLGPAMTSGSFWHGQ